MGVLSKYALKLVGSYLTQLYINPIQTKSITSCILSSLANYVSQHMAHGRVLNSDTLVAYGLFGLLFGGLVPHYFYKIMNDFLAENSKSPLIQLLLIERLFFMPAFTFFSLYTLSRLEGRAHQYSFDNASVTFPSVARANFKYLTLLQFINIYFVPPVLRVFVSNLIAFFWIIILSYLRQKKKQQ
ncbi:hypothetical protein RUM44_013583 [Polyplax serrata]|uniref:Peroxisomal membrane protein 2 n=1 Tax=Polyplax serrata TaxID=468196 RepID=A0ABR1BEK1_POLSC